jgi:hypothetical protein
VSFRFTRANNDKRIHQGSSPPNIADRDGNRLHYRRGRTRVSDYCEARGGPLGGSGTIGIEQNQKWVDVPFKIYLCDDPVDIAVLIPPYQLTLNLPLPDENFNIQYGQDAYFLGFPYNIGSPMVPNGGYPLAFVKHALISVIQPLNLEKKESLYQMDGYNNPGFSGGPVVVKDFSKPEFTYAVIAVISGFQPEVVPEVSRNPIESPDKASQKSKEQPWRIGRKPDGSYFEYVDTENYAVLNTGILSAFNLAPAIDLIRKHPDGPEEKTLSAQPVLK